MASGAETAASCYSYASRAPSVTAAGCRNRACVESLSHWLPANAWRRLPKWPHLAIPTPASILPSQPQATESERVSNPYAIGCPLTLGASCRNGRIPMFLDYLCTETSASIISCTYFSENARVSPMLQPFCVNPRPIMRFIHILLEFLCTK